MKEKRVVGSLVLMLLFGFVSFADNVTTGFMIKTEDFSYFRIERDNEDSPDYIEVDRGDVSCILKRRYKGFGIYEYEPLLYKVEMQEKEKLAYPENILFWLEKKTEVMGDMDE